MMSWPNLRSVMSLFLVVGLLALVTWVPVIQGAESSYVKKATWQETMLATRAKLAEQPEPAPAKLGRWFTTGPLKAKGFSDALFPEQGVDLDAKGPDHQPLWQPRPELRDGQVVNLPTSGGSESTYLFRTITVDRNTILPAGFGSDDGMAVWLNGKQILSVDAARGVGAASDRADLELAAGENQLLLKIYNRGGGHGYFFSATPEQTDSLSGLWQQIEQDFPLQCGWMKRHLPNNRHLAWFQAGEDVELEKEMIGRVVRELGNAGGAVQAELDKLVAASVAPTDRRWLDLYEKASLVRYLPDELKRLNIEATRLAITDLVETFGGRYRKGQEYLRRINEFDQRVRAIQQALAQGDRNATKQIPDLIAGFLKLREEALLDNPLLDFDKLLFIRRAANRLGLPQNWQGNCAMAKNGYDNEIAVLSPVSPRGKRTTLFKPEKGEFVGDVDLHFDAGKMLFSMPGSNGRWQIFEIGADQGRTCRRGQLRRLLPARRTDHLRFDPLLPRRSVRGRKQHGGQPVHHGRPGRKRAAALFRPGPRLVPHGAQRRPRALFPLGVFRLAPLFHPAAVPHESRRHEPDGVLRQQLALAELDLLRPAHPQPSDQGGGGDLRPPRCAADG